MIMWNVIVIFRCHTSNMRQILARHKWEIMMFIVISYMECKPIPWSIVGICLLIGVHDIMLGYEVPRSRMQSHTQQCPEDQICQSSSSCPLVYHGVKCKGCEVIDVFPLGRSFRVDKCRSETVKEWLEKAPDNFSRSGTKEPSFQVGWNVYVHDMFSLEPMMLHVISFEGCRCGYAHGEICEYANDSIECHVFRRESMRCFMHGKGETVVDGSGEGIATEEPCVPWCSLQQVNGE